MAEVWNNAAVAELLGSSEPAIRTAKSRNKDQLLEGQHWIKDDAGRVLWTAEGVQVLRGLLKTDTPPLLGSDTQVLQGADTAPLPLDYQPADPPRMAEVSSSFDIDQRLQPLADQIAVQVIEQRLPVLVHQAIDRLLADPSDLDNQRMAEVLDRVGTGLGLVKLSGAIAGGLRAALTASQESLKQLPGGVNHG